jgi:fatty acid desaturase
MYCRISGKEFVMFRRVDALLFFAALLVIAALVCFLPSNNLLPAWAYLAGPVLWFFGTVIAIVWMVCRFFPASPAGSDPPTESSSGRRSADRRNIRRAGLLIIAGILPLLLCRTMEAL